MGANRTFRSIFGDEERAAKEQQAADGALEVALDAGEECAAGETDDKQEEEQEEEREEDDDGMWSDDAAPGDGDDLLVDSNDAVDAAAADNGVASVRADSDVL